jgi:hypothetical protein
VADPVARAGWSGSVRRLGWGHGVLPSEWCPATWPSSRHVSRLAGREISPLRVGPRWPISEIDGLASASRRHWTAIRVMCRRAGIHGRRPPPSPVSLSITTSSCPVHSDNCFSRINVITFGTDTYPAHTRATLSPQIRSNHNEYPPPINPTVPPHTPSTTTSTPPNTHTNSQKDHHIVTPI